MSIGRLRKNRNHALFLTPSILLPKDNAFPHLFKSFKQPVSYFNTTLLMCFRSVIFHKLLRSLDPDPGSVKRKDPDPQVPKITHPYGSNPDTDLKHFL